MASRTAITTLRRKMKQTLHGQGRKRQLRVKGTTPKLLPLEGSLESYFEAQKEGKK